MNEVNLNLTLNSLHASFIAEKILIAANRHRHHRKMNLKEKQKSSIIANFARSLGTTSMTAIC